MKKTFFPTILFSVGIILVVILTAVSNPNFSISAFAKNGIIVSANDLSEEDLLKTQKEIETEIVTEIVTTEKTTEYLSEIESVENETEISSEAVKSTEPTNELINESTTEAITEKVIQDVVSTTVEQTTAAPVVEQKTETKEVVVEKEYEEPKDNYNENNYYFSSDYFPNDAVCRFSFDNDSYYVYCYYGSSQDITNCENCANYFWYYDTLVVCDHNYQGFWRVRNAYRGLTCRLQFPDGSVDVYKCVDVNEDGYNNGNGIVDKYTGENLITGEFVTYTCNDWGGYNVTIARWVRI